MGRKLKTGVKGRGAFRTTPESRLKKELPSTWGSWHSMMRRCYEPNFNTYQWYGAVGVTVCERWRNSFTAFVDDMGERPEGMTLDRIDTKSCYEPDNCKWSSVREQNRNKGNQIRVEFNGKQTRLKDVAEHLGIKYTTLYTRLTVQGLTGESLFAQVKGN